MREYIISSVDDGVQLVGEVEERPGPEPTESKSISSIGIGTAQNRL
ncbi:hypothetical protein ACFFQF_27725 [Haladaptatus pallidirubidus]